MNIGRSKRTLVFMVALVALMAIGFGSVLGPVHIGMMGDDGMHTCPFMQSALCSMDAVAHISEWQSAFVTIVHSLSTAITALLLSLAILAVSLYALASRSFLEVLAFSRVRVRQRRILEASIIDPLLLALSQGTLNPKTF